MVRVSLSAEVAVAFAGSDPGMLKPLVVDALSEIGTDISHDRAKPLDDVSPETADLIVTLCTEDVSPLSLVR